MPSRFNADEKKNKGRDNIKADNGHSDDDEDRFALIEEKPQVSVTMFYLQK